MRFRHRDAGPLTHCIVLPSEALTDDSTAINDDNARWQRVTNLCEGRYTGTAHRLTGPGLITKNAWRESTAAGRGDRIEPQPSFEAYAFVASDFRTVVLGLSSRWWQR